MSTLPLCPANMHPERFRSVLRIATDDGLRLYTEVADDWQLTDHRACDPGWLRAARFRSAGGYSRAWLIRSRGHAKTLDLGISATWTLWAARCRISGIGAAADKEQAGHLLAAIENLVLANPFLAETLEIQKHRVINRRTKSQLQIIASDERSAFGSTPDFCVCDELTIWRDQKFWETLFSAMMKRKHSMLAIISNAGWLESWQATLFGKVQDREDWYINALPGTVASWLSPAAVAEARSLLPPLTARRLIDNLWSPGEGDAIEADDLAAAFTLSGPVERRLDNHDCAAIGVDFGLRHDWAAVSVMFGDTRAQRVTVGHCESWSPRMYGGVIPFDVVEDAIRGLARRFDTQIVIYDGWQLEDMMGRLRSDGFRTINQYPAGIGAAKTKDAVAKRLIQSFISRKIDLYNYPLLTRDLKQVVVKTTATGIALESPRNEFGHGDRLSSMAMILPNMWATIEEGFPESREVTFGQVYV